MTPTSQPVESSHSVPDLAAPDATPDAEAVADAVRGGAFRITNVRANASGLAASTSPVPTQILAF